MDVKTIAVIGAGTTGRAIAVAAAVGGYQTILEDVNETLLTRALTWVGQAFAEGVKGGEIDAHTRETALARITTSFAVDEAIRDAELIIEAVSEELEMKLELFTIFDRFAKPNAIFASHSSSLSISDFTDIVLGRDRCIGMHFFNPIPEMRLVEIVRTPYTSDETVATCVSVAHRMHKETVVVNETPGFITSRMDALIGNEAFAMLEAGIASAAEIDKAIKLGFDHMMGPLERADLDGLDARLKILEYLHQTLGERFRPSPLLKRYVEEGRLGRKTGRGVYDYSRGVEQ